ncbi:interleukin-1 receptor type 2 [Hyla sarda]|uniref:interleukin-1 receptor type 2 n=1 Tax=Hyla sarda TaxID=327740 RepID=UPI0024C2B878|nr:interleukin-1 receptor type 2 [Hyla sarda]
MFYLCSSIRKHSIVLRKRKMWFSFILFGTYFLETSGFNVYRLKTGEKCQVQITHSMDYYALNEELATIECPVSQYLLQDLSTVPLIWTRNGAEALDKEGKPRIQSKKDALWFLPALKEDTGIYTCIVSNTSYCAEISLSLNIMSYTQDSFPYIKYEQFAHENTVSMMPCPALPKDLKNVTLNWFKDGEPLLNDSSKYTYLDGTTSVLIHDVHHEDEGYYTCQLTVSLENIDYTMSRLIQLQIIDEVREQHPVIVNAHHETIAAAIGSKLVIPCKVFAGNDDDDVMIWWTANDSFISDYSKDHRVTEGKCQKTTGTDGQYFELLLVFERIEEEDFITDFKCIALNDYGQEVLPAQITQAASSSFAWYIAAVPALVVFLIIVIIFISKHRKCGNHYSLAKS